MTSTNPIEQIIAAREAALARLKGRCEAAVAAADKNLGDAGKVADTELQAALKEAQAEFAASLKRMVAQINATRNAAFATARQTRHAQADTAQQTRDAAVSSARRAMDDGQASVEAIWAKYCQSIASCLTDKPSVCHVCAATSPTAGASSDIEAQLEQIGVRQTFAFTIILSGAEHTDELADALYEAGCSDALLHSQNGRVGLDFDREAATLSEAIASAKSDIARSKVTVTVVEVSVDHGRSGSSA